MGILTLDINCPHCLKENAVIQAFAEKRKGNTAVYDVAFCCRSCEKSLIAEVEVHGMINGGPLKESRENENVNITIRNNPKYTLLKVYPKAQSHAAPNNTPIRAAKFFIEAKDNLLRCNFETSVMLCRKVLDIATREILGEESNKEQLSQRISMLHGKGKITEQMKDWAHIVRIDSNGAVHSDEEFTKEEAEEMIGFTDVFLIYSFTLPAMVTAKQQAAAS